MLTRDDCRYMLSLLAARSSELTARIRVPVGASDPIIDTAEHEEVFALVVKLRDLALALGSRDHEGAVSTDMEGDVWLNCDCGFSHDFRTARVDPVHILEVFTTHQPKE